MAENLLSKKYTEESVLHTYSIYNAPVEFKRAPDSITKQSIYQLEAQEKRAYHEIDPSIDNFEDFITFIRNLFSSKYLNDQKAISSFGNSRVFFETINDARDQYVKERLSQKGQSWQFTLQVQNEAKEKLEKLSLSLGKDTELTQIGENLWKVVQKSFDIREVKKIVNKALGTHFWAEDTNKRSSSTSKVAITKFLGEVGEDVFKWIESPDSVNTFYMEYDDPFAYGAEKLHAAENNLSERKQILDGMDWIYKTIVSRFLNNWQGISVELQMAFKHTWEENISHRWQDVALFMRKGGDTALSGAFGEFQGALISNYLLERIGKSKPTLRAIISNPLQKGEQLRRDITILKDIGIQVKNYDPQNKLDISTTVYAGELQKSGAFSVGGLDSMFHFIANYYFNRSYAIQNASLKNELTDQVLPSYFAQIANLDLGEVIRRDTVSFYLISGRYLVPASHIANAVYKNTLYAPISITSSYDESKTDQEYNQWHNKKSTPPAYLDFWENNNGNWEPTQKNLETYNNLLSKQISFRSKFSRENFTVENYKLW